MTVTDMRQVLADFDELRNRLAVQAFDTLMDAERPLLSRTSGSMTRLSRWTELPPCQAGLSAALRRAFAMPSDETGRKFEELLHRLA
jgi:hypothetical protein